ncbi:MAG: alpha/beta fold hydrolase [Actinomycetes bacterium]
MLHGVGESAVGWQPVYQALSDNYDVIAFDLPGFGRSPALPPGIAPTAAALADAVEGELDRLGVARFHVAGYSLGARVALELATRGRTLSVIAIAPDGLGTPLERVHQAAALLSGRTLARLLAPIASPVAATGAGRSLFFAIWSGAVPGSCRPMMLVSCCWTSKVAEDLVAVGQAAERHRN